MDFGLLFALASAIGLAILIVKSKRDAFNAGADSVASRVNENSARALERMGKADAEKLDTSERLRSGKF